MLTYPSIDPVIFSVGPLAVRWYGLMYVVGFGVGLWLARRRAATTPSTWTPSEIDDLIFYCALGVILGGRLGWVLFYGFEHLADDPWMIMRIWQGGMSFHGGLTGVMIAAAVFSWRRRRRAGDVLDFLAPLPCLGIFAGRVANFINGELWGKPTSSALGFTIDSRNLHPVQTQEAISLCTRLQIDPCVLHLHASQLYEGVLEGLVLFAILWTYTAKPRPRLAPAGMFLLFYGLFRFAIEFVRIPDQGRGYLLFDWVTMGQILSTPMILAGAFILAIAYRRNAPSGNWQAAATKA